MVSANESDVFEIRYSSPDPENAALVVNEVTRQYLTAQEEEEAKRSRNIVAALTEEMDVAGKGRQVAAKRKCRPRRSRFPAKSRSWRSPTRTPRPGTRWASCKPG